MELRFMALSGVAALLVGGALGCGSSSGGLGSAGAAVEGGPCSPGETASCTCADQTASALVCQPTGTFGSCLCGSSGAPAPGGGGAASGGGGGGAPAPGADLPCDVKALLEQRCWSCHGEEPYFGAPMSLTGAADFHRISSDPGMTMGPMVLRRIRDEAKPMPQSPNKRLTAAEMAVLDGWINGGARPATCSGGAVPGTPVDPTGPTDPSVTPPPPEPPDVQCFEIRTHAPGSKDPYDVPQQPDLYQCFYSAPPWGDQRVHVVSARPIIDNPRVLHHWILYNNSGAVPDGEVAACGGAHPDAQFIAGWAPGGEPMELPADVGLVVPGAGFTLETHYNNNAGPQRDASGVEICVTTKLRSNEAAIHWLGTESIRLPSGGDAVGTCRPGNTGPVTVLTASPHMHLQGRHMKTVIHRAAGGTDTLLDVDFSFDAQVGYPTPTVIQPGDTLTTTCTYGGPAYFGEGTNQEMCYNFVLAYPAGGLAQVGGSFARQNNCTGL